jgi:hypothetical protein
MTNKKLRTGAGESRKTASQLLLCVLMNVSGRGRLLPDNNNNQYVFIVCYIVLNARPPTPAHPENAALYGLSAKCLNSRSRPDY